MGLILSSQKHFFSQSFLLLKLLPIHITCIWNIFICRHLEGRLGGCLSVCVCLFVPKFWVRCKEGKTTLIFGSDVHLGSSVRSKRVGYDLTKSSRLPGGYFVMTEVGRNWRIRRMEAGRSPLSSSRLGLLELLLAFRSRIPAQGATCQRVYLEALKTWPDKLAVLPTLARLYLETKF